MSLGGCCSWSRCWYRRVERRRNDPRVGLAPGYFPWTEATSNIDHLDNDPRVARSTRRPATSGSSTPTSPSPVTNAIVGSFNGFQVYDMSDPTNPTLRRRSCALAARVTRRCTATCCSCPWRRPGAGSTAAPRAPPEPVNPDRFRGVRIFDISDIDNPVQLPGVQTCRGSHTHTIVTSPRDKKNIYIYNSGTAGSERQRS